MLPNLFKRFVVAASCGALVACQSVAPMVDLRVLFIDRFSDRDNFDAASPLKAGVMAVRTDCDQALEHWYEAASRNAIVAVANNLGAAALHRCAGPAFDLRQAQSQLEFAFLSSTQQAVLYNLGSGYADGKLQSIYSTAAADFLYWAIASGKVAGKFDEKTLERALARLHALDAHRANRARAVTGASWNNAEFLNFVERSRQIIRANTANLVAAQPKGTSRLNHVASSESANLQARKRLQDAYRSWLESKDCGPFVTILRELGNEPAALNTLGMFTYYGCRENGPPQDKAAGLRLMQTAASASRPDIAAFANIAQLYFPGGDLHDGRNAWIGKLLLLRAYRLAAERDTSAGAKKTILDLLTASDSHAATVATRQSNPATQHAINAARTEQTTGSLRSTVSPDSGAGIGDLLTVLGGIALIVLAVTAAASSGTPGAATGLMSPGSSRTRGSAAADALAAKRCSSDFDCSFGDRCVKPQFESNGVCLKAVDSDGLPIFRGPSSNSIGVETDKRCYSDADCPVTFRCDAKLNACIRR